MQSANITSNVTLRPCQEILCICRKITLITITNFDSKLMQSTIISGVKMSVVN